MDELARRFPLDGEEKDGLRPKEGLRSRSLIRTLCSLSLSLSRSPELVPGRDLLDDCDWEFGRGLELDMVFPQMFVEKKGVAFCVGVVAEGLCMAGRACGSYPSKVQPW